MLYIRIIQLILLYKLGLQSQALVVSSISTATTNDDDTAPSTSIGLDTGTLRQVLLVHRHGDRAPISVPKSDPLGQDPLWQLYGLGQLTNEGKQRVYEMGQLIRDRYDEFMAHSVNKNERFSRSSAVKRCVESAQLFLAAFLELDRLGNVDGDKLVWNLTSSLARQWQPASVTSVPVQFDGMLAASARCKSLCRESQRVEKSKAVRQVFDEFAEEISILERVYSIKINNLHELTNIIDTVVIESTYMPTKVSSEVMSIKHRLLEANNLAFGFMQSTIKLRRLRAGLLMSDLVESMVAMRDRNDNSSKVQVKRFLHYSTHDTMLTVLLGMLESWRNQQPDYASNLAFELHQLDNEWFVRVLYMSQVPGEPEELKLPACSRGNDRCSLDGFQQMMKPYLFASGWQQWMFECDNQLDKIDPYRQSS